MKAVLHVIVALALLGAARGSDLVLTPVGRLPRACVHAAPDGAHVRVEGGVVKVFDGETGAALSARRSCGSGAWPTDAERLRGRRHRHSRSTAASRDMPAGGWDDDKGDGSGWQAYVKQDTGNATDALLGQWTVPPDPAEEAQTLFLFTGLQNIDWVPPNPPPDGAFDIIQPVLQYGNSAAGDLGGWSIASWYVTLGADVVYTTLKSVKAGSTIFGNMTQTGPTTWWINAVDTSTGVSSGTSVTRSLLAAQPWIYVTLEVYDVDDCRQFPAKGSTSVFSELKLSVGGHSATPDWQIGRSGQHPAECGATATINSPAKVTIEF